MTTQPNAAFGGQEAAGLQGRRDGDLLRLYTTRRSQEAFSELVRRYSRLVYSICLRETGNSTLAEDAAQGVFVLLSRKAQSLENRETLADWLYAASRYLSRNLCKQERRRQMREAHAVQEMSLPVVAEDRDTLWEQIEPHLNETLDRLKAADRQAILLRFVQQQSLAEVGASLGVSENTARMRVQRALEKVRAHLGRLGVVVSLALLAATLLERSASAVPPALIERLSTPSVGLPGSRTSALAAAVRLVSLRFSLMSALKPFLVLIVAAGIAVGYGPLQTFLLQPLLFPQRLSPREQRQVFQAIDGTWRGSLEYADDRTGQRFTYPTTVIVHRLGNEAGLRLTATYVGSSAVDQTTFTKEGRMGTFSVANGGAQSSHALAGVGALVQMPGGGFAFEGKNSARNADVRIRFTLGSNALTIQEEYRLAEQKQYQFRNRFTLRRVVKPS